MTSNENVNAVANSLLAFAEICRPIIDMVAGYRNGLIDAGFNPDTADIMTADYHRHILTILISN